MLRTKATNHIQGISICSKNPFFQALWQQLPSILLQADYCDNSCVFFFFFFLLFSALCFSFFSPLWWRGGRSLPHHQLQLCFSTLLSVADVETMKKLPGVFKKKHKTAGAFWTTGHNSGWFLKHYGTWKETDVLFLCDPAHYKESFFELPVYPLP